MEESHPSNDENLSIHSTDSESIHTEDLDDIDLEDESLGLTEEEKALLTEDRQLREQRQKMLNSEVLELESQQRIQYEMRVIMLDDLLNRIEYLVNQYSEEK